MESRIESLKIKLLKVDEVIKNHRRLQIDYENIQNSYSLLLKKEQKYGKLLKRTSTLHCQVAKENEDLKQKLKNLEEHACELEKWKLEYEKVLQCNLQLNEKINIMHSDYNCKEKREHLLKLCHELFQNRNRSKQVARLWKTFYKKYKVELDYYQLPDLKIDEPELKKSKKEEPIEDDGIVVDGYKTPELTSVTDLTSVPSVESGYHEGDSVIESTGSYTSKCDLGLDQYLDDRDLNMNDGSNQLCEVGWLDDEDTRESYDSDIEKGISENLTDAVNVQNGLDSLVDLKDLSQQLNPADSSSRELTDFSTILNISIFSNEVLSANEEFAETQCSDIPIESEHLFSPTQTAPPSKEIGKSFQDDESNGVKISLNEQLNLLHISHVEENSFQAKDNISVNREEDLELNQGQLDCPVENQFLEDDSCSNISSKNSEENQEQAEQTIDDVDDEEINILGEEMERTLLRDQADAEVAKITEGMLSLYKRPPPLLSPIKSPPRKNKKSVSERSLFSPVGSEKLKEKNVQEFNNSSSKNLLPFFDKSKEQGGLQLPVEINEKAGECSSDTAEKFGKEIRGIRRLSFVGDKSRDENRRELESGLETFVNPARDKSDERQLVLETTVRDESEDQNQFTRYYQNFANPGGAESDESELVLQTTVRDESKDENQCAPGCQTPVSIFKESESRIELNFDLQDPVRDKDAEQNLGELNVDPTKKNVEPKETFEYVSAPSAERNETEVNFESTDIIPEEDLEKTAEILENLSSPIKNKNEDSIEIDVPVLKEKSKRKNSKKRKCKEKDKKSTKKVKVEKNELLMKNPFSKKNRNGLDKIIAEKVFMMQRKFAKIKMRQKSHNKKSGLVKSSWDVEDLEESDVVEKNSVMDSPENLDKCKNFVEIGANNSDEQCKNFTEENFNGEISSKNRKALKEKLLDYFGESMEEDLEVSQGNENSGGEKVVNLTDLAQKDSVADVGEQDPEPEPIEEVVTIREEKHSAIVAAEKIQNFVEAVQVVLDKNISIVLDDNCSFTPAADFEEETRILDPVAKDFSCGNKDGYDENMENIIDLSQKNSVTDFIEQNPLINYTEPVQEEFVIREGEKNFKSDENLKNLTEPMLVQQKDFDGSRFYRAAANFEDEDSIPINLSCKNRDKNFSLDARHFLQQDIQRPDQIIEPSSENLNESFTFGPAEVSPQVFIEDSNTDVSLEDANKSFDVGIRFQEEIRSPDPYTEEDSPVSPMECIECFSDGIPDEDLHEKICFDEDLPEKISSNEDSDEEKLVIDFTEENLEETPNADPRVNPSFTSAAPSVTSGHRYQLRCRSKSSGKNSDSEVCKNGKRKRKTTSPKMIPAKNQKLPVEKEKNKSTFKSVPKDTDISAKKNQNCDSRSNVYSLDVDPGEKMVLRTRKRRIEKETGSEYDSDESKTLSQLLQEREGKEAAKAIKNPANNFFYLDKNNLSVPDKNPQLKNKPIGSSISECKNSQVPEEITKPKNAFDQLTSRVRKRIARGKTDNVRPVAVEKSDAIMPIEMCVLCRGPCTNTCRKIIAEEQLPNNCRVRNRIIAKSKPVVPSSTPSNVNTKVDAPGEKVGSRAEVQTVESDLLSSIITGMDNTGKIFKCDAPRRFATFVPVCETEGKGTQFHESSLVPNLPGDKKTRKGCGADHILNVIGEIEIDDLIKNSKQDGKVDVLLKTGPKAKNLVMKALKTYTEVIMQSKDESQDAVKSCLTTLLGIHEEVIARQMVAMVMESYGEEDLPTEPPNPPMSMTQIRLFVILYFLHQNSENHKNLKTLILDIIWEKLFPESFGWPDDPVSVMAKFYVSICKNDNNLFKIWKFFRTALSEMHQRFPLVIHQILRVWPDIVPNANLMNGKFVDLKMAAVQIILQTTRTDADRRPNQAKTLMNIKEFLTKFLNYDMNMNFDEYTKHVMNGFAEGAEKSYSCLSLIVRCRRWDWVKSKIVPTLLEFINFWADGKISNEMGIKSLRLLQDASENAPKKRNCDVDNIYGCLKNILTSGKMNHEQELEIVFTLLDFKNYINPQQNVLSEWTPKKAISDDLKDEIKEALTDKKEIVKKNLGKSKRNFNCKSQVSNKNIDNSNNKIDNMSNSNQNKKKRKRKNRKKNKKVAAPSGTAENVVPERQFKK